ncbi:MAG: TetR family transcriptional regulator C-terminal domain-containing protein [Acidobacteria bacterium]|jgi:TetR/AcrR family transcriptional repressor of bet genes|nr:TetR family transcriptional regulator C-terminal domain-containing protein [Acidobacteriota bacterium]
MPKIVDHEERRRALATAAVDAIAEGGLEDVRLADIARAAGVTTGAIAHYFPDKDAVLAAALEEVCTRLLARIGTPDGPPSLAEIAEALPVNKEMRKAWRVWLAYWGRAPFSEKLRLIHQQYYLDIETALFEDLQHAVPDARRTAQAIIAVVDGVGTRATLEPESWPPARQRALLSQLLSPLLPAP